MEDYQDETDTGSESDTDTGSKLLGEDDTSYTISHPSGENYILPKELLTDAHHDYLKSLPKQDNSFDLESLIKQNATPAPGPGGEINYEALGQTPLPKEESTLPKAGPETAGLMSVPGEMPTTDGEPTGEMPKAPQVPQPQDIFSQLGPYGEPLREQAAATKDIYGAKTAESVAIEGALKKAEAAQAEVASRYKQTYDDLDKEFNQVKQDYISKKIDPKQWWNNKSLGSKVSTGIGILLSGLGSGLSGQPNMAMQMVNKEIDKDIEAQKENIGKTGNILSLNMQKYRNIKDAEAASRLQINAGLQSQIAMQAARTNSTVAKAQAQMALGQLGMQAKQLQNQLALSQTQAQVLGVGGREGGIRKDQEPFQLLADPKYREQRVVIGDRAYQANDKAAATEMNKTEKLVEPIFSIVEQLEALGTRPQWSAKDKEKAHGLRADLSMKIPQLKGYARFNEGQANAVLSQIDDPTKLKELITGGALAKQFKQNLGEELEASRKQNLVGYKGIHEAVPSFKKLGKK
jgi:hypothetical protein